MVQLAYPGSFPGGGDGGGGGGGEGGGAKNRKFSKSENFFKLN